MKAYYPLKGILTFILLSLSPSCWAQQADEEPPAPEVESAIKEPPKIPFVAAPKVLAQDVDKNDLSWINVLNEEHFVFKRSNQGRIYRGNAILFHTTGENPLHNRLTNPLSIQFSRLGWNTFSPNIGFPDFPREEKTNKPTEQNHTNLQDSPQPGSSEQITSNNDESDNAPAVDQPTTKTDPDENKVESFFEKKESYQEYFSLICQETLKLVTISNEPTIFVANGEAAYWLLDCLKKISPQTPIVLIQPKAPSFANDDIDSTLQSFGNPMLAFAVEKNDDYFVKLIKQQKWQSPRQRFDQSALLDPKINIENTTIAKLITGWVKTVNSQSQ